MSNLAKKIGIVDYGVGNLFSLHKALKESEKNVFITEDKDEVLGMDGLILPGVGSFKAGMEGLRIRKLVEPLQKFAESGKPVLGICLGAQLMFDAGYEFGKSAGLGIIPGQAIAFKGLTDGAKIPHIGWNNIRPQPGLLWQDTIFKSVQNGGYVYFVHSFVLKPKNKEDVLALTDYGGKTFCSAIKNGNIYGCQFHPEKSAKEGLKIIKSFIRLVKND